MQHAEEAALFFFWFRSASHGGLLRFFILSIRTCFIYQERQLVLRVLLRGGGGAEAAVQQHAKGAVEGMHAGGWLALADDGAALVGPLENGAVQVEDVAALRCALLLPQGARKDAGAVADAAVAYDGPPGRVALRHERGDGCSWRDGVRQGERR